MAEERVRAVDPAGGPAPSTPGNEPPARDGALPTRRRGGAGPALATMPDVTAPMDTLDPTAPSAPGAVPSDENADAVDDGEGPARDGSAAARATPPARTRSTPSGSSVQARHRQSSPSEGLTTSSRVLSRIARFGSGRGATTSPLLEPLLRTVRTVHPKADLSLIEKAFDVAAAAHAGQKRRSGDPYITHPVAVAGILAELGMTPPTLAAALLHDTVEDTSYTLEQLRKDFGDEVAMLVDGVTKLDKVTYGDAAQAETVRKMVVAMSRDIRVLVIKLADRLHNARTWRYVPQASAARKARETLEIYAPLAHRLGMNTIKWELEDLSFATLYPKVYDEIVRLVAERAPAREDYLAQVREISQRRPARRRRSGPRSPAGRSTTTRSTRR